MRLVDVFLLLLVIVVSAWIARASNPAARLVLLGSSLMISAALFLPTSLLIAVAGTEGLAWLESVASTYSWTLSNGAHFVAFVWLALVLWTLRPDLRDWRIVLGLVVLAVAAELVQGLTVDRSARLGDVGVNMLGGSVGLILGVVTVQVWERFRRAIPAGERSC